MRIPQCERPICAAWPTLHQHMVWQVLAGKWSPHLLYCSVLAEQGYSSVCQRAETIMVMSGLGLIPSYDATPLTFAAPYE